MISRFLESLYYPTANHVLTGRIGGVKIYDWIYFWVLGAFSTVIVIFIVTSLQKKKSFVSGIRESLPRCKKILLVTVLGVMSVQTLSQFQFIQRSHAFHASETLYHSRIRQFAEFCQARAPGKQQADLMTDMDIRQDPGMYLHRLLAYDLYPLDIRRIRPGERRYLILFQKENAAAHIPADYRITGQWDSKDLIAEKKAAS